MTGVKSREENPAKVQHVATDAGCGRVPPGYASTDVMKYADCRGLTALPLLRTVLATHLAGQRQLVAARHTHTTHAVTSPNVSRTSL